MGWLPAVPVLAASEEWAAVLVQVRQIHTPDLSTVGELQLPSRAVQARLAKVRGKRSMIDPDVIDRIFVVQQPRLHELV